MFRAATPTATALAVLLALGGCAAPPPRPDVVVIVVDTLRRDHLGCYGYGRDTSPAIDALAAGAVRYAHAYSQAPWTTPSVAALLTSRYPSETGITEEPDLLDDRFELLDEVLAERGYATAAAVSHYFLAAKWNFDQGFDRFDESNALGHAGISSPGVTDTALALVDAHRAEAPERPMFLFVHYFDPHYNYVEHPGHTFSQGLAYDGPVTSGMTYTDLRDMAPSLDERDRAYLVSLYDSEIAFTDLHVGRLLGGLDRRGMLDDALVVFTADHGEELLERGKIGHGGSLYDELIHVPLLVKYPRQPSGAVVETPVGLIDVYPTVLDFLGIEARHPISGRSFLTDSPGEEPRPRLVFSETNWGHYRSVIRGHQKVIRRLTTGQTFVFDLARDPAERDNLSSRLAGSGWAADFELLDGRLRSWTEYLKRAAGQARQVEIDDEERRRLQALGYLD